MTWLRALAVALALGSVMPDVARGAEIALSGQVRGTDGSPLAGAAVELLPVADLYQTAREATSGDSRARAARALSDREGFYLLRAPGPGMYAVRVSANGRVPAEIAALPLVEPAVLPPAELPAAAAASVRVVDGAGRPVAGAVLRPIDESVDVDAPRWRPGWPVLRTGADGAVSIPLPGKEAHVPAWTAVAPGLVSRKVQISGPLTIRLEPAAEPATSMIELAVREGDGRPVAGAFVAAAGGDLPLAMTGPDGLARFAPAAGPLTVLASDGRVWKGALPKAKAGAPATVTLPRPGALAGGVVDAEDRAPLAGAVVASTADLGRSAVADARGSYALANAGGEKPGLMAWAAAHFRAEVAVPAGARGTTIALLPGAMLTGRVVDPGQRPIPGAAIEPRSGGMMEFRLARRYPLRPAASATDGSFAILLPPRSGGSLDVSASGFGPRSIALPALAPRSRPAPITVVLDAGRAAIGHLAGPDGAPVAGAVVQILAAGREDALLLTATAGVPRGGERGSGGGSGGSGATTDGQGAFRLQHLPAGRLALVARKPGYAPLVLPGIDLPAGRGTADLGTLQLLPGAVLEGRVTDGRRPLAGARVGLAVSGRSLHGSRTMGLPPVETGADGSFRFADLQPGTTIDLQVSHDGFLGRSLTKVEVPTAHPLVVALDRAARISGRVLDESRAPVAGAWVRADAEDRDLPPAQRFGGGGAAGTDGRFTLTSAPAGRVWLEASARGFETARVTGLTVPAGGELDDVEIVMKRGGVIAGQVTTDAGLPVAGAEVRAEGAGTATDGDGAFRLEGVAPGRHRVSAAHPDLGRASQEVEVGAGEARVDLRLSRGVSLEGRVVDRAGGPVAGASVWLGGRGFPASTASDVQGGFRFENVAPGSYRLSAGRGESAGGPARTVEVAGEPLAGLDLVLDPGVVLSGKIAGARSQDLPTLAVEAQGAKGWAGPGEVAADGSYRIEGLAPGDWMVTAAASATGRRGQGRVAIDEGAAEAHLDVELGAGLSLQGTVRVNGRPLDGAQVQLQAEGGQLAAADVTNHLGAFRLEGLSAGHATLSVSSRAPWLLEQRALDLSEDATVDLDIAAGALSGSVVDAASGQPLAEATVAIQKVAEGEIMGLPPTSSDVEGHFGFETLAAGAYAVTVQKPGYAAQKLQVSVQPQGTATLVVPLSPAAAGAPAEPSKP